MKKITLLLVSLSLFAFNACLKNNSSGSTTITCTGVSAASQKDTMIAFCKKNNITYTEAPSGYLYQIINAGSGAPPTASNSKVTVTYKGTLLNGTVFDGHTNMELTFNTLIQGWKYALPMIGKGGIIKIVLPSALAYDCVPTGNIPANSPLYFEINLLDYN